MTSDADDGEVITFYTCPGSISGLSEKNKDIVKYAAEN